MRPKLARSAGDGRNVSPINAMPKKKRRLKIRHNVGILADPDDLIAARKLFSATIAQHCCSIATAGKPAFFMGICGAVDRAAIRTCEAADFVLQSPDNRILGRSTVRFVTRKLSRDPKARLWRGTRTAWPRLFFA
jgi:hypothetical protein